MTVPAVPEGMQSITPSLVCSPCADAIAWYVEVLGAVEVGDRMVGPDGLVGHAEMDVSGSRIMLGDPWPDSPVVSPRTLGGSPVALFLYRADAKEVWDRAVARGAEVVFPYEKQFYGHEGGRIRDPFGHYWGIGRQVEVVSEQEMAERVASFYDAGS